MWCKDSKTVLKIEIRHTVHDFWDWRVTSDVILGQAGWASSIPQTKGASYPANTAHSIK